MKATSIRLTDYEKDALTALAAKMKCHTRASGKPCWKIMLQHIAEGRLEISNPLEKTAR